MTRPFGVVASILFAVTAGVTSAPAQAPRAPARQPVPVTYDATAELLAEVRGLRAEVTSAAKTSLRAQLLTARLQVQEQRIMYLERQRSEVAVRVSAAERERVHLTSELQRLQDRRPQIVDAEEARQIDQLLPGLRAELQQRQNAEAALRGEEQQVLSAIATEQGRWNDFNTRLDELERAVY